MAERNPDDERSGLIVSSLMEAFEPLMLGDQHGFRTKFRKMARDPFAFYRGTACLFYADVGEGGAYAGFDEDWVDDDGSRVWIQGDLHAENFGTYLDADGRLVFDVNDFDEAYLGHWTWDLARFVASLSLLCWQKALPDGTIDDLVAGYVRAYAAQVEHYRRVADDTEWALTLDTAEGAVLDALHRAKLSTRFGMLESMTVVEDYRRRFADATGVRRLEDDEAAAVREAFSSYLETLPQIHRGTVTFDVLDVVGRSGFGIGSAGLPAYSVLIEGFTQALDNDVVLSMKQGNVAAPSRVVARRARRRVLRAPRPPHGHLAAGPAGARRPVPRLDVAARSRRPGRLRRQRGVAVRGRPRLGRRLRARRPRGARPPARAARPRRSTAWPTRSPTRTSSRSASRRSSAAPSGTTSTALVATMTAFAHDYARRARDDHRLFVDAFRGGAFEHVAPA